MKLQWKILNSTMCGIVEQTQREVSRARAVVFKIPMYLLYLSNIFYVLPIHFIYLIL